MVSQQLIDNDHCLSGIHITGEEGVGDLIHVELESIAIAALFIDLIGELIDEEKIVVDLVVAVEAISQVEQPGQVGAAAPGLGIREVGVDRVGIEPPVDPGGVKVIALVGEGVEKCQISLPESKLFPAGGGEPEIEWQAFPTGIPRLFGDGIHEVVLPSVKGEHAVLQVGSDAEIAELIVAQQAGVNTTLQLQGELVDELF